MRFKQRLALGIVLSRNLVLVPCSTVRFDDQALIGPPEVGDHLLPSQPERSVDIRMSEPTAQNEVENDILELAPRGCRSGCHDARELLGSPASGKAAKRIDELGNTDLPK